MIPGIERLEKLKFCDAQTLTTPISIAHRGARAYALESTESAFRKAWELDADMWEIDVRMSSDNVCVVSHDDDTASLSPKSRSIAGSKWSELVGIVLNNGQTLITFDQVIELARDLGRSLYVEIKQPGCELDVWRLLEKHDFRKAIIGSFFPSVITSLREVGCDRPLSILVRVGEDPFGAAEITDADIIHLCWLNASESPDLLVTDELVEEARRRDLAIVLWHEERRAVLDRLEHRPVLAICSDRPETLKPYRRDKVRPVRIVCHRGANHFAPENTLEAARICYGQRFDFVELDARTSSDGELVVIHDETVDRTTNGSGRVADMTFGELKGLDAGSWFDPHFASERIPSLSEMLNLASKASGGLYIELKEAAPEKILNAVMAAGMLDRCFFGSENPQTMRQLRALSSEATLMARRRDFPSLEAAIEDCGSHIIEYDVTVDDLIEAKICRHLGVHTMIYDRTDQIAQLDALAAISPDYINLDRPDLFKRVVNAKTAPPTNQ